MAGAVIETEPDALDLLEFDPLVSSNTQFKLLWSLLDPSKNGGSEVLGYQIEYLKDGEALWTTIQTGNTVVDYTISGFVGGTTNTFKIAAFNKYGVGSFTEDLVLVAGQEPDAVSAPTIEISQLYVIIAWVPSFNNYSPITGYRVLIQDGTSAYTDATVDCNSEYSSVTIQTSCYIPMTTLINTYSLAYED